MAGVRPLGGGRIFAWTVLLWGVAFLGSYCTLAQLAITEGLGLPPMALQVSTVVVFLWGHELLATSVGGDSSARPTDPGIRLIQKEGDASGAAEPTPPGSSAAAGRFASPQGRCFAFSHQLSMLRKSLK